MTYDTDAINNIKFTQGFRGYDTAEVDEFLDDMIREIEKLNNTIKTLKEEVSKEKRKNQLNLQEIDRLTKMNESLSEAAKEAPQVVEVPVEAPPAEPQPAQFKKITSLEDIKHTPEYQQMTQTLSDTLIDARQTAAKIVKTAEKHAQDIVEEGERKVQDRVNALNYEINENQKKLNAITSMVLNAKQRFKKDFQNQIAALDSIKIDDEAQPVEEEPPVFEPAPAPPEVKEEIKTEEYAKPEFTDLPPLETVVEEVLEEKAEEQKQESANTESEVSAFDFSALKKQMAKRDEELGLEKKAEPVIQKPITEPKPEAEQNVSDAEENQQYIEIALSAYNDNKHHNTDYPNTSSNIRINEDDEEGGIYQPENRSVLSSVIEEILNNKKNED